MLQPPTLTTPPTHPTFDSHETALKPPAQIDLDALLASIQSMVTMPGPFHP